MTFSACRVLLHVGPAAAIMAVHLLHLPALPSSASSNLRFGRGDAQLAATTAMRGRRCLTKCCGFVREFEMYDQYYYLLSSD